MHSTHSRRLPARVYRRRRIVVGVVAVLVIFLLARLVGALLGGAGGTQAAPTTTLDTTTTTLARPPQCTTGDLVITEDPNNAWATVIVDTNRGIQASYAPTDLSSIGEAGFVTAEGLSVRALMIDDLRALREAAAANGTPIDVLAAYRSYDAQQQILDLRITEFGEEEAYRRVARPGHSEHQLGTTIDVTSEGLTDVDQAWGSSPTGQWIAANAATFGFVISYPQGREADTCYTYEPWHLRYLGRELAAQVVESRLTVREYLHAFHTPANGPNEP